MEQEIYYNTSVRGLPKMDWARAQRRHFPFIANRSQILNNKIEKKSLRISQLNSAKSYSEKRHFCLQVNQSHLDDYF